MIIAFWIQRCIEVGKTTALWKKVNLNEKYHHFKNMQCSMFTFPLWICLKQYCACVFVCTVLLLYFNYGKFTWHFSRITLVTITNEGYIIEIIVKNIFLTVCKYYNQYHSNTVITYHVLNDQLQLNAHSTIRYIRSLL